MKCTREAGGRSGSEVMASTAHTKTGKTPLPYTNVDRWAILGNRGCILALGIIQHEPEKKGKKREKKIPT